MADDTQTYGSSPSDREHELIEAARRQVGSSQPLTAPTVRRAAGSDDSNVGGLPGAGAIPGYDLLREIHRGGQGVVYQALQRSTKRKVAIKVMREGPFAGPRDRVRFEREVEILGQLKHRNIVAVHDSGTAAGTFYIVMDYISGRALDAYLAANELSVPETLELGARICEAVHAAHLRGIIHRDLKPGNIRVDAEGEPHILDFGLAKIGTAAVTDESSPRLLSQTGQFIGSLPWASPEQAEGHTDAIDIRTDVYSLGVVLYQMLTGTFPYTVTGTMREVLDSIVHAEPTKPSTIRMLRGRIDDEVETILLKSLSKQPERRYQSAGELARDIRRYLAQEPIEAKRDTPLANWYMLRKTLRRYRVPGAIVAAFGVLIVAFAITMTFMYGRAEREARRAELVADVLADTLISIDPDVAKGTNPTALREMLDRAALVVRTKLADEPLARATVGDALGTAYLKLGAYDEAEKHLREALETRRDLLGDRHPDTAESLDHLAAWLIWGESDYPAAESRAREALAIRQQLFDRAEVGGEAVAESLNTLGWALKKQTGYKESEALYRKALAIRIELHGEGHLDVAETMNNLAEVLRVNKQHTEAESLVRRALEIRTELLGEHHTLVATSQAALGSILRDMERYDEAEPLLRSALDIRRDLLGEHNATVASMNKLALFLRERCRYAEAEELFRSALELRIRVLGDEHEHLAVSKHNLALVLYAQGEHTEAESLYREAIVLWRERLGDRHRHVASGLHALAVLLRECGGLVEAQQLCREALDIRREALQEDNPLVGASHLLLGQLLLDQGDVEAAEEPLRESLTVYEAAAPDGHWSAANARSVLGECLAALGRDQEAEPLMVEAYPVIRDAPCRARSLAIEALERIIDFYESRGGPESAIQYRAQLEGLGSPGETDDS